MVASAPELGIRREFEIGSDGSFELGPLPPTTWQVQAAPPGREPVQLAAVGLASGQCLRLSPLMVPAPATLQLSVRDCAAELPDDLRIVVCSDTRRISLAPSTEDLRRGEARLDPLSLENGSYLVRIVTRGRAEWFRRILLEPGGLVRLAVDLERGSPSELALELPAARTVHGWIDLVFTPVGGGEPVMLERARPRDRDASGGYRLAPSLPVGEYLVEAATEEGLRGSTTLRVRDVVGGLARIILN
jgi:hypothetical protein